MGLYQDAPPVPCVVGYEVSGTIAAAGEGVSQFRVGDRVLALTVFKGQADRAIVDVGTVFSMPDEMSFEEGAALPVNYLTAYHLLFHVARVRPNAKVLMHGAAGGVGLAVLDLCKFVG